ncbi:hypothetical protein LSAT2_030929 [Lamellibrachia satsuma]|nr:hypothetical protein LSAT2_030929 [Lamellibrachia satsuma]
MYLPAVVIVGFYFDRRRSLATGISACGSSIGGVVVPPLLEYLVQVYGWEIAVLVVAGLMPLCFLAGRAFKRLPVDTEVRRLKKARRLVKASLRECKLQRSQSVPQEIGFDDPERPALRPERSLSYKPPYDYVCIDEPIQLDTYSNKITVPRVTNLEAVYGHSLRRLRRMEKMFWELGHPMCRKDILYNANVTNLEQFRRSRDMEVHIVSGGIFGSVTALPNQDTGDTREPSGCVHIKTLTKTLIRDKICFAYCVTSFLCMTGFYTPFVYLPQKTMHVGISSRDGAFLISIINATNTVSRVLVGWISNKPRFDCIIISSVAMTLGGVATILCPLCNTYPLLALYAAVYGVCIGWLCVMFSGQQAAFYLSGSAMTLAGLLSFTLRPLVNRRKRLVQLSSIKSMMPPTKFQKRKRYGVREAHSWTTGGKETELNGQDNMALGFLDLEKAVTRFRERWPRPR